LWINVLCWGCFLGLLIFFSGNPSCLAADGSQSPVSTCLLHEIKKCKQSWLTMSELSMSQKECCHNLSQSVSCIKLFLHKYIAARVTDDNKVIFHIIHVVFKRLFQLARPFCELHCGYFDLLPIAEDGGNYRRWDRYDYSRRNFQLHMYYYII